MAMAGKALLHSTLDETQRLVRASAARPRLLRRKTAGGLALTRATACSSSS